MSVDRLVPSAHGTSGSRDASLQSFASEWDSAGLKSARPQHVAGLLQHVLADMDALPLAELNEFPHHTRHPGKLHACGHESRSRRCSVCTTGRDGGHAAAGHGRHLRLRDHGARPRLPRRHATPGNPRHRCRQPAGAGPADRGQRIGIATSASIPGFRIATRRCQRSSRANCVLMKPENRARITTQVVPWFAGAAAGYVGLDGAVIGIDS